MSDYIRELGIPAVHFMPGFYMTGISGSMFRQSPPDNAWTLALPIPSHTPIPLFDTARDLGKFIKGIVLNKEKALGKEVYGATAYVKAEEIVATFKKLYPEAGATARYYELPKDVYLNILTKQAGMPDFAAEELYENMQLMNVFGYYFGKTLDWSHSLLEDPLTTWEEHAKNAKAWAELK